MKMLYPDGVSDIQYAEMQKAFYAGAAAAISVMEMVGDNDDISESEGAKIFQDLHVEVMVFLKKVS